MDAGTGTDLPKGLVDIHSHVLPGIDDGSRDVEESLELLTALRGAGFTNVFCTPHSRDHAYDVGFDQCIHLTAKLQRHVDLAGLDMRVHPGGEHNLQGDLRDQDRPDWSLPAGRFFLFDFWNQEPPTYLEPAVQRLRKLRITPILAHPERYAWVQRDPDAAAAWLETMDLELQLNFWILADGASDAWARRYGKAKHSAADVARRWLEQKRYTYSASDTHRLEGMDLRLRGLEVLRSEIDADYFDALLRRNPSRLLAAV